MLRLVLAAVLALLTVRAHRTAAQRDERALARARGRLALAMLAQVAALVPLASGVPGGVRLPLLAVAAAAGLVAWEAFAQLLATGTRKRDVAPRLLLLGVAGITLATPAPWGVPAAFALLGGLAFRWRHAVPTRRKYGLAVAAIALAAAGYFRLATLAGVANANGLPSLERQLWAIANATRLALAMLTSLGAFALLLAIVRDPSLGIRTVGRRLGLSHSLVLVIPVALLLMLWTATTVLGVNRDRALVAARWLGSEAGQLQSELGHALAGGQPGAVAALAAAWDGAAPGTRACVLEDGRARRVAGQALEGLEAAAGPLADSLAARPAGMLVTLDGVPWIAAAARTGGRAAIMLVPADTLVGRVAGAVSGGVSHLTTNDGNVILPESTRPAAAPARDSSKVAAGPPAAADTLHRNRIQTSISVGSTRYRITGDISARSFFLGGNSFVPALGWRGGHWERGEMMLSVEVSPREVLRGLFRNSASDPMGYVPMVVIAMLGALMALVALWDILMVTNMSRGVATAIGALRDAARKLEAGDLTHRIELRGDDDLWDVARAVNEAAGGLERAQAAEKDRARMESELAVARRIQSRLLPKESPKVAGLEIAGTSQPALEVGGDYFDHIEMGDGRIALVIGDVSGKGVPAALLMSAFRAALVSHDLRHEAPDALATRLNDFLYRSVDPGKFVTAFIGFLDSANGELHYVNAGHNPSLLVRADGTHEWLAEGGTILGILPVGAYSSGRVTLQFGDVLTLYTDGVTEGANADKEQWGEERLVAESVRLRERPCAELARALVATVRAFEGATGPADDITVIVARRAR